MDEQAAAKSRDNRSSDEVVGAPEVRIAAWFTQFQSHVRKFLSRRLFVPAKDLDDLAQEVFLRTLRYSKDADVKNPLGYLLRVASNVASEWRERKRVSQPHESEWLQELLIDEVKETEHAVIRQAASEALQNAIDSLPEWPRRALELHVMHGLTYKQIATELNRNPRQIVRDLGNAYSELRMKLRIEDI
jgi:RNA polymerase sigma factor (sigma-70 family)